MKSRERKKSQKKVASEESRVTRKMRTRKMSGMSRIVVFFAMVRGSGGSKSRLAKMAGAER